MTGNSFINSPRLYFTSESVTEGHPDKICDQVSDAVLDAIIAEDPDARVACECATTTGLMIVMGEITTSTYVEIAEIARETIREIGYTRAKYGFDCDTCGVILSIKEQSTDIALGVDRALEAKTGEMNDAEIEAIGAGDQGMMIGFACKETPELMPMPIMLAHKLCKRLAEVRKDKTLSYLRPDGKSQVTVEYQYGLPKRVDTIVLAAQHSPEVNQSQIRADLLDKVIKHVVPTDMLCFSGKEGRRIVEPGEHELQVGASSADIRLRAAVTLAGAVRALGRQWRMESRCEVER